MPTLVDANGLPIDSGRIRERQTARVAALRNQYLDGQLAGLTPARIQAALTQADNGDLFVQHRLFSDMEERDAHIKCEMGKRKNAPVCVDWNIEPPRGASATEKANAEWLEEILRDAADPIEDIIVALMDAVGHGFAPVELEWTYEGSYLLPKFHPVPQEWFQMDRDRARLTLRDNTLDGADLQPAGWIVHSGSKAKNGYLARGGIHRTLVWPFIYLAYAIGDYAELLETWGLPILIGKYPGGTPEPEQDALLRAIRSLGHDARAIMPADMMMEIVQSAGGGGVGRPAHLAMVDWAERSISKAILGQTMSAEAKSTGLGSANAELHAEVRDDILKSDARQLSATLTRDLLYPLLALNRGKIDGLARCPRFVIDTSEADDIASYADALPPLVDLGMRIPMEWAHEKLRIPQPKSKGDPVLSRRQGVSADPAADPGGGPPPSPTAGRTSPTPDEPGSAALAALQAKKEERQAAEQDALSQLADAMSDEWRPTVGVAVDPVLALAESAQSLDELRAGLPAIIQQMDVSALADLIARGLFAAHVAGRSVPDTGDRAA